MLRKVVVFGLSCITVFQVQSMDPDLLSWNPCIIELYTDDDAKYFLIEAFKRGDALAVEFFLRVNKNLQEDEEIQNILQPSDPRENVSTYAHLLKSNRVSRETMREMFYQKIKFFKTHLRKAFCLA